MIPALAAIALAATASGAQCTPDNSIRTTVTAIGEDLDRYLGRCVTVSGPASSNAIFSGVEGLYRSQRLRADGTADPRELRRHRLGLYSENDAIRSRRSSLPWLTVTGMVDSCERRKARALARAVAEGGKDSVVIMSGDCIGEAVIDAAAFSVDRSRKPRRLTGERARLAVGDLVLAPNDWPHLAALRAVGEEFRAALRSGDRPALARLNDIGVKPGGHDQSLLDSLTQSSRSAFAEPRRDPSLPMAVFIRRHKLEGASAGMPPGEPSGTICFGRRGGRPVAWPISALDADNDPSRPYACTDIVWRDWAKRKIGLDTRLSRGGWLAEPARSD